MFRLALFALGALGLALATPAATAENEKKTISLRALLDMVREPLTAGESMAKRPEMAEEEMADMKVAIPSRVIQLWIDLVPVLEAAGKAPEHVDIFPPDLAAMLKDEAEVRIKAKNLRASIDKLRALAEAAATAGDKPEARQVTVPRAWIDALFAERQAMVLHALEVWQGRRAGGPPLLMRQNQGTFACFGDGTFHKVAESYVPEEGPVFAAPYGEKGTWNLYQVINRPTTWVQAEIEAAKMPSPYGDKKVTGHLVSIRSYAENMFVARLVTGIEQSWIGLSDRRIEAGSDWRGPWEWTSGEPFDFRKWHSGEPNSAVAAKVPMEEDGVALYRVPDVQKNAHWSDFPAGDEPTNARRFPYIVEWNLNAAEPPKGAALPEPLFPANLPGPAGGDGFFGLRMVYDCGNCAPIRNATDSFTSGRGRALEEKLTVLHHGDPDAMGHILLFGDPQPIPGQTPDKEEKNTTLLCRGRIHIAEAGTYTFGVHHDDGFALRVKGAKWKSVSGLCCIDPVDASTIAHAFPSGDGTSHGVIELAAGDYEIEFFGFQLAGQFYFELYSAKGEFQDDMDTDTWRLVGYKSRGKVPMPAIAAPGWQIEVTPPNALTTPAFDLADRAVQRRSRKLAEPSPMVAYFDPDGWENFHPKPCIPFPDGVPGKDDDFFALRAKATLEIPADGLYWLGYYSANGGRLIVNGQSWKRTVLKGPGQTHVEEDILQNKPDDWYGNRALGELELKAGRYEIEFLGVHGKGSWAWDFVHTAAPGLPVRPLRAGAARVEDDHDGLPLIK
jgi:hypothetical protein